QALNITRETAGNRVIADAISQVHDRVKEGESIVQPLETSGAFPPMVISMIDVGEETGQLPEMLLKIADVYDDEVDNSVAALTSLLEPMMIVFLAAFVLGVSGYVQEKGKRARAEAEIAAMSAALESYKADNGIYPFDPNSNALDARSSANPVGYQNASLYLFTQLSGLNANQIPISGAKSYFSFKPLMLGGPRDANGNLTSVSYILDPF